MNEIYELNFHGNRQEIETEKLKMRELMSHFPKALGTVDETKYVLQDDDKSKQTDYLESKPLVGPLAPALAKPVPKPSIFGIGEQQSVKPKKEVNSQTAAQNLTNWGNKENTLGFGNGKDVAAFLSPKKETNETKVPKSPFDLGGNTAKEEKWSFDPGVQFQGYGAVTSSKPCIKTVKNDSLRLEKSNIENVADALERGNISCNTNAVANNVTATTTTIPPGLYGGETDRDYSEELRKIKQNLPPMALDILDNSGIKIVVLDNLHSVTKNGKIIKRDGRYFAEKNKIYLDSKKVDERTMFSEVVHVAQDYLGMTGIGKSNLEFQEHVIKDLYYSQKLRKIFGEDSPYEHTASTDNDYIFLMEIAFDEKGILDLNKFLTGINNFISSFQEEYVPSNSYQTPAVKDFNYNWRELFDIFGIEYK